MLATTKRLMIAAVLSLIVVTTHATVQAPEFSFRAIDGAPVTAEAVRGQVAVFGFGASWLPLTRTQMEGLKKLADQYAGRGVAVYWVSTESDSPKSKNFADDNQLREMARRYKITVLRDADGAVSKRLGIDQLPATLILDKQGQIAAKIGGLDPTTDVARQLAEQLDKILKS